MKFKHLLVFVLSLSTGASSALQIDWMIGAFSNLMVIDGAVTTYASFTPVYEMRLMHIGLDGAYSAIRGFNTFRYVGTGPHYAPPEDGKIGAITSLPDDSALSYNQYIVALYEKATGKYYFVSKAVGGAGIDPFALPEVYDDPFMNGPPFISEEELEYWPTAGNAEHRFYQGAEIPPFCTWLAKHDLVQADLAGLDADLVNQAFAVGANPTNFTGVALAVEGVAFGPGAITGALSLVARDGAQNASAVTQLNGGAALSLLSSTTLGGGEATLPSTFDLADGTFESTVGTTNATQFLRLKLAVPNVW